VKFIFNIIQKIIKSKEKKKMKSKLLATLLALSLVLTLTACGEPDPEPQAPDNRPTPEQNTPEQPTVNDPPSDEQDLPSDPPSEDETPPEDNGEPIEIDLSNKGITDTQLAEMVASGEIPANVTGLNLTSNQISNITPLNGLTKLTWLYMGNNQISDLTPIKDLTNLEFLVFGNNQVSDITPLNGLTKLTWLDLQNNYITQQAVDNLNATLSNCIIEIGTQLLSPDSGNDNTPSQSGTYTITFIGNGGLVYEGAGSTGVETLTAKIATGDPVPFPHAIKDGFEFYGWFIDEALTIRWETSTPITSDLTVYAKWG